MRIINVTRIIEVWKWTEAVHVLELAERFSEVILLPQHIQLQCLCCLPHYNFKTLKISCTFDMHTFGFWLTQTLKPMRLHLAATVPNFWSFYQLFPVAFEVHDLHVACGSVHSLSADAEAKTRQIRKLQDDFAAESEKHRQTPETVKRLSRKLLLMSKVFTSSHVVVVAAAAASCCCCCCCHEPIKQCKLYGDTCSEETRNCFNVFNCFTRFNMDRIMKDDRCLIKTIKAEHTHTHTHTLGFCLASRFFQRLGRSPKVSCSELLWQYCMNYSNKYFCSYCQIIITVEVSEAINQMLALKPLCGIDGWFWFVSNISFLY